MASPETPSHHNRDKNELLIELSTVETKIQPFLETALAVDEMLRLDYLLEQRDQLLDELEGLV